MRFDLTPTALLLQKLTAKVRELEITDLRLKHQARYGRRKSRYIERDRAALAAQAAKLGKMISGIASGARMVGWLQENVVVPREFRKSYEFEFYIDRMIRGRKSVY